MKSITAGGEARKESRRPLTSSRIDRSVPSPLYHAMASEPCIGNAITHVRRNAKAFATQLLSGPATQVA